MATGTELRNAIRGKGLLVQDAAKLLEISRQTLSTYFSKAELDQDIIDNVKDKLDILLTPAEGNIGVTKKLSTLIRDQTEISNAIEATVRVLKIKMIELETKVKKRSLASVSLEYDRLMKDELKQIEDDMRKKQ